MKRAQNTVGVVIPTYRETESLRSLLLSLAESENLVGYVVVVDDSENGESAKIALSLVNHFEERKKHLEILSNYIKTGRGSAVRQGLQTLYLHKEIEVFVEMDGDESHRPCEIGVMCEYVEDDNFIIASRYLPKSSISGWSSRRKVMSKIVNSLIRSVLNIEYADCTNGYRAYPRSCVKILITQQPKVFDFLYLSEQALLLTRAGFMGREIPSQFMNRTHGKSSVNLKVLLMALYSLCQIKYAVIRGTL